MEQLDLEYTTIERRLISGAAERRVPINGSMELLPICNMNCKMCYVHLSRQEAEAQGGLLPMKTWLTIARQMQEAGVLFLLLTGGEPLLYPDFKPLYLALKQMGFILTVNTNGTRIDENWADFFAQNKPRRMNITLYGAKNKTYETLCGYRDGYDHAMRGILLLRERGVDVKISVSVTRENQADLPEILKKARELGLPVSVDTYMMPARREQTGDFSYESRLSPEEAAKWKVFAVKEELGEEVFEQYCKKMVQEQENFVPEEENRKSKCLAGKCSFAINWQGKMRPCVIMTELSASVMEQGIWKAWNQIAEGVDGIRLHPKCGSCSLRPVCHTCGACALLEAGNYGALPEYMCRYAEETMRLLRQFSCGKNVEF